MLTRPWIWSLVTTLAVQWSPACSLATVYLPELGMSNVHLLWETGRGSCQHWAGFLLLCNLEKCQIVRENLNPPVSDCMNRRSGAVLGCCSQQTALIRQTVARQTRGTELRQAEAILQQKKVGRFEAAAQCVMVAHTPLKMQMCKPLAKFHLMIS